MSKKVTLLTIIYCLILCLISAGCKDPLKKEVPPPASTINIGDKSISVQKLIVPLITTKDPIKILDLSHKGDNFYISLRSNDNNFASIFAFRDTNNVLTPIQTFGKDGVEKLDSKMILDVEMGEGGTIYFMRNGFHAYKDGADNISLSKKTSATKIAVSTDETIAYLYGNDNFDLATIKDNSVEKLDPSFLKNRAVPFKGGLSYVVLDGETIYGGGKITPNGLNSIASFTKSGKLLKQYGKASKIAKDSIISLMSFAVLDDYICVIDGFTFKVWKKDDTYMGSINNSDFLGENSNAYKLTKLSGNTVAMLSYQRNSKTKSIDLEIYKLSL